MTIIEQTLVHQELFGGLEPPGFCQLPSIYFTWGPTVFKVAIFLLLTSEAPLPYNLCK